MVVQLGTPLERVLQERGGRPGGWTRKRLAAEMGVSRQVLHKWMTGARPWPADRKVQVAALLGLDVTELFGEG